MSHGLSEADTRKALELYAAGWTQDRIGIELDVSTRAVGQLLRESGFSRKQRVPNFEARVHQMSLDGLSPRDIAKDIGVSVDAVRGVRRRLGLDVTVTADHEMIKRVHELSAQGLAAADIATKVYISYRSVLKILARG